VNNEIVLCEESSDKICAFTNQPSDSDEFPMEVSPITSLVARYWFEIVSISRRDYRVEFKNNGKTQKHYYLFTLEHIDSFLDNQNWHVLKLDRKYVYRLICLFHQNYIITGD